MERYPILEDTIGNGFVSVDDVIILYAGVDILMVCAWSHFQLDN